MSVHIDDVFMSGRMDTLEKIKKINKLELNIQESRKVKNVLGVFINGVVTQKVCTLK